MSIPVKMSSQTHELIEKKDIAVNEYVWDQTVQSTLPVAQARIIRFGLLCMVRISAPLTKAVTSGEQYTLLTKFPSGYAPLVAEYSLPVDNGLINIESNGIYYIPSVNKNSGSGLNINVFYICSES